MAMDNVPKNVEKRLKNIEERISEVERKITQNEIEERCPHCGEVLETRYLLGLNGVRVEVCQNCGEEVGSK